MSDILIPSMTSGMILSSDGTSRIGVSPGTNGQFLISDTSNSSGLSWSTYGETGAIKQIFYTEITATTTQVLITGITGSPDEINVDIYARSIAGSSLTTSNAFIRFNQDTTSNAYSSFGFRSKNSTSIIVSHEYNNTNAIYLANDTTGVVFWNSGAPTYLRFKIMNASSSSQNKHCFYNAQKVEGTSSSSFFAISAWKNTSPITSILIDFTNISGISSGTISVYGGAF